MIFVIGTSGSGKTHTIDLLVKCRPDLMHVRASRVLTSLGRPLRLRTGLEADQNQVALVGHLEELGLTGRSNVILDGHGVIETDEGPSRIDDQIVDQLGVLAIIVIYDDSNAIAARKQSKGERQTREDATASQIREDAFARDIAARLAIPVHHVRSGDVTALSQVVDQVRREVIDAGTR